MKITLALIFVVLIAAVLISGCVQQGPAGGTQGTGGGQATASQAEDQAARTVDQEMGNAIGNMTLNDVQNDLLKQG